MFIKYCPGCAGQPYTEDIMSAKCPVCGANLMAASVTEEELAGRPHLSENGQNAVPNSVPGTAPNFGSGFNSGESNFGYGTIPGGSGVGINNNAINTQPSSKKRNSLNGVIYNYSSSDSEAGNYKRNVFRKIAESVVYGQRLEDVIHRFAVSTDGGEQIPVVVHGTIAAGITLNEGQQVKVEGTMRSGVMYARRIYVLNNGIESRVHFKIDFLKLFFAVIALAMFLFAAYMLIFNMDGVNQALNTVAEFVIITAIVFVVLFILTFLLFGKILLIGMALGGAMKYIALIELVLSMVAAWFIMSKLGGILGSLSIASALPALGPILIMVCGIILIISVLKV